jgi:hypothetical protein
VVVSATHHVVEHLHVKLTVTSIHEIQ